MSDPDPHATPPNAAGPAPATPVPPAPNAKEERNWAVFCHLGALAQYVIPIPAANIVAPLILWSLKRKEWPLVDDQGKEALNFQITATLALLACIPLVFLCIGIPLAIAVAIADLVFVIIAAIKVADGERYRYPLCIRFVK